MRIELSDEQAYEAQRAIEAEIRRTNEALSLPVVKGLPELHERGLNSVRVLSEVHAMLRHARH